MRRAALVGIISMLISVAAAAYLSGVMAFQFLNAATGADPDVVLEAAAAAANLQFLIGAAVMIAALVAAFIAARALLYGLGIANPLTVLRGPLVVCVIGAVLNVILSLPFIFVVLLAGLASGAYQVFDESFNPLTTAQLPGRPATAPRHIGANPATRGGDVSDFI